MRAEQIVEAILFASDAPLRADEIARADEDLDEDRVEEALQALRRLYLESERAFDLVEIAEGYQIQTRPEFAPYLERFDTVPRPSRLSGPALETLAILAYRQPLGRLEVEYIRGVGSSGVIRTLIDRGLIEVVGRGEGLGRPLMYGTTLRFLEHFGFRSLEDLPRPEELPVVLRDPEHPILPDDEEEAEAAGTRSNGRKTDPAQGDLGIPAAAEDGAEPEDDGAEFEGDGAEPGEDGAEPEEAGVQAEEAGARTSAEAGSRPGAKAEENTE